MATAIPKACLASSAIRCRDVETGPGRISRGGVERKTERTPHDKRDVTRLNRPTEGPVRVGDTSQSARATLSELGVESTRVHLQSDQRMT